MTFVLISQSGTASSAVNEVVSTSTTPRPDGDPATATVVKVEPGTEGNSTDALGSSSVNNSTAGPATALALGSKDMKGNSTSALHWLADLATQKARDDSKGELRFVIRVAKSAETFSGFMYMGYFYRIFGARFTFILCLNKLSITQ